MKRKLIIDDLLYFFITIFCLYTIWFQYVFFPIDGLLTVIGLVLVGLTATRVLNNPRKFSVNTFFLFLFVLFAGISSFFFSLSQRVAINTLIEVMKYCIPMIAIVVFSNKQKGNVLKITYSVFGACMLLAVSSFFENVYTVSYASDTSMISDSALNANSFSSYMLLGGIVTLILIANSEKRKWLYIIALIIELLAQVNAASRRGIIVFVFLMLSYVFSDLSLNRKKGIVQKIITILFVLVIVMMILTNMEELGSRFIGIQRVMGSFTSGDTLREYYKNIAWELFKRSPLIGCGLNAVAITCGMYSHSFYYELLASCGVLGSFFMFFFLLKNLWSFFREAFIKVDGNICKKIYASICMWAVFALFISGFAVVMIYDSWFYIMLGLIVSYHNELDLKSKKIRLV